MSVLYRAIWNDDRDELVPAALAAFRDWVLHKSDGDFVTPASGRMIGTTSVSIRRPDGTWAKAPQPAEVTVHLADQGEHGILRAARASLVETRDDGSRWSTTLRTWSCAEAEDSDVGEGRGWLWVDVEAVTYDSLIDIVIAAPRLVRDLVASGREPRRRCVQLSGDTTRYEGADAAEVLAGLLSHADRDMPVVVFSDDPARTRPPSAPPLFDDAVRLVAARVLGIAAATVIDPAASEALSAILGAHHSVWGGAFRMYLPGVDPATGRDEWRHRYVTGDRYLRYRDTAATLVARALGPAAAARRAPTSYAAAKLLIDGARHADAAELAELLSLADEEAAQQRQVAARQAAEYADLLSEHQKALEDRARYASDLAAAVGRLRYAESLVPAAAAESYWQSHAVVGSVPITAATPSQAAIQAQQHLTDYLALPDDACVDLDQLDSAQEAGAWGQTSWEALRALHAYAAELATGQEPGSFWTWCEQSGHPLAWRATSKKLSMTESETVENNEKLWRRRVLPVSKDIDPTGLMYMSAHMKIAEGGGNLAPRIYFHVSRVTGKAHVGYFGPHKNMPNTKT